MNGSLRDSLRNTFRKFSDDAEYRSLLRTSFLALLIRIGGVTTGFFVTLITSRYFGADALGIVSICIAILSFSSVFGKFGLDVALIRYISSFQSSGNDSAIKGVYLIALRIIIPVTILIAVLLFFLAPWMAKTLFHKPGLSELLKTNAWIVIPLVLLLVNSECLRGIRKIRLFTFLQTVSVSLFACVCLFVFAFMTISREIPAYVQFVCITASGLLSMMLWIKFSGMTRHRATFEVSATELMKTSTPMFTTTLMQLLMSWGATLILAGYVSESEVGVYNALVRISVFTNITILAVNSLVLPRFAESFSSGSIDTMKKDSADSSKLIFLSSLPIFIVLALCPRFILSVFGKEFPGNENALYILLATQLIVCFAGLPSQILNMSGRQHTLRNIAAFSAVVNISGCFLLIPRFGIYGACYAQLAGTFSWNLLSILSVRRHFGFFTFFGGAS